MTDKKDNKKEEKKTEKIEEDKKNMKTVIRKRFNGIVISDKMDKTIVVNIDRVKAHPKYKKRYTVSKKYRVHDEKNKFKEGDKVEFIECRPLSKNKRWRVVYTK